MKLKLLKTLFYKFFKNKVHRIKLKEWFIKILNECRIFLRMKEDFFEKYIFYRKGFIKIALQHGAQLVPTFSFGEAYIYNIRSTQPGTWIHTLQEKFKNMVGFAPVLFMGRGLFQYSFGLIPHRKPVNIVVGEPIQVEMGIIFLTNDIFRQLWCRLEKKYNRRTSHGSFREIKNDI